MLVQKSYCEVPHCRLQLSVGEAAAGTVRRVPASTSPTKRSSWQQSTRTQAICRLAGDGNTEKVSEPGTVCAPRCVEAGLDALSMLLATCIFKARRHQLRDTPQRKHTSVCTHMEALPSLSSLSLPVSLSLPLNPSLRDNHSLNCTYTQYTINIHHTYTTKLPQLAGHSFHPSTDSLHPSYQPPLTILSPSLPDFRLTSTCQWWMDSIVRRLVGLMKYRYSWVSGGYAFSTISSTSAADRSLRAQQTRWLTPSSKLYG
mmetsp:Transcript_29039/g.72417  ORF Transcript_29039/g.72417 Transcript_29039/m.72417 type:complete len:258 (+) Transcript_29039:207-980(+)